MKNKKIITKHLRHACLQMSQKEKGIEDIETAKRIWEESQGETLDAISIRSKIFQDLKFCFLCGEPLPEFRAFKNGIPHCLMSCCV